jgi:hypothetical protein
MGVDWEHYVIVGVKFKYNELEKRLKFKPECDSFVEIDEQFPDSDIKSQWKDLKAGDYVFITDGMNGQYSILGLIVSMGEAYEGIDMIDCLAAYKQYKTKVSKKLKQIGVMDPVSVYAFTHFH